MTSTRHFTAETAREIGSDLGIDWKIALAHLNEFPDYYTRLEKMEAEAEAEHAGR